eukprot:TRINITY_DN9504_c0_g1::TRINITY_DN9504_c0_g1_i1::g.236::m.236 TRINITY_DN9504_c0_g1::TRINITY_DN9504_c0_g1_i1::g.236  ORF type:complete len:249 (-),score=2.82 TRINITY_DN9504_c0_g1_i1:819-1565(-)
MSQSARNLTSKSNLSQTLEPEDDLPIYNPPNFTLQDTLSRSSLRYSSGFKSQTSRFPDIKPGEISDYLGLGHNDEVWQHKSRMQCFVTPRHGSSKCPEYAFRPRPRNFDLDLSTSTFFKPSEVILRGNDSVQNYEPCLEGHNRYTGDTLFESIRKSPRKYQPSFTSTGPDERNTYMRPVKMSGPDPYNTYGSNSAEWHKHPRKPSAPFTSAVPRFSALDGRKNRSYFHARSLSDRALMQTNRFYNNNY